MTVPGFDQEPPDCARFRHAFPFEAYLNGELLPAVALDVQLHLDRCEACQQTVEVEHALRRRLRRELRRIPAPGDLEGRIRSRIVWRDRRERLTRSLRWIALGTLTSAAILALVLWSFGVDLSRSDLVEDLVSKHRLYSRLDTPAEMVSDSRLEVGNWIRRQLALSIPVPDFSQGGFRLIGARLGSYRGSPLAHLFYEKGRALQSLFILPASNVSLPRQGWTTLDGHHVAMRQFAGHQVLVGRSGRVIFVLVSTLDREDLIECARALLREGGQRPAGARGGGHGNISAEAGVRKVGFVSNNTSLGRAQAWAAGRTF